MALSEEAEARLARALSGYIRATPARELPGELKRWRSWRPQTVAARGDELVARLEDAGLRARVLHWLDDKPSLSKADAKILRLACERPDGWQRKVSAAVARPVREKSKMDELEQLRGRVERERERATQAREEARRAKEDARATLQAERKRSAQIESHLERTQRELEHARSAVGRLEAQVAKARATEEREVRRERRAADKAKAARDELRSQVRDIRKEATELRGRIRELERRPGAVKRSSPGRPSKDKQAPAERRPLPVPHGLLEDSPETLLAWLDHPGVRLLIDGYNVTKAERGFGELSLADQRDRLVQEAARLARKHAVEATIVFDGSEVPPGTRRKPRLPVKVEYSKSNETADDHLIARLEALPPDPVVVVTNDKELQERAREADASVATSDQLLALLR